MNNSYEYKNCSIIISRKDSNVYAYKDGNLLCIAHDEPTIESMIDTLLTE